MPIRWSWLRQPHRSARPRIPCRPSRPSRPSCLLPRTPGASAKPCMASHESVSTTHAKLQRREGVWVLVDLDSTNGTFVDGDQVKGEMPLAPGASVRFGEIGLVFEPTDDAAAVAKGGSTRMMEVMTMEPAPKPKAQPPAPKPAAPRPVAAKPVAGKPAAAKPKGAKAPVAQQKKGSGCGGSAALLLLMIVGLVYWVFI
ncbi:MAG: hypothetical protein DMD54_13400 [Gemmatimonadetes bacterium]|nr:MAG: hypothetical protein DMD54_13400 [Gemmatimonadota bacterium]